MNRFLALALLLIPTFGGTIRSLAQGGDAGMLAWWSFSSDRIQGSIIKAWQGGPDITPSGSYRFAAEPPPGRIELAGRTEQLLVAESPAKALLPTEAFTVEAWVRVDQSQETAGIFSATQESGAARRGFVLGIQEGRFVFGLATRTSGKLVVLPASRPFSPGEWHHVLGTYDGRQQRLFVDGLASGESSENSGPISYGQAGKVLIGGYESDVGFRRFQGALREIRLFQKALTGDEVSTRYASRRKEFAAAGLEPIRLEPAYGPFVDWIDKGRARVTWETDERMPSVVEVFSPNGSQTRVEDGNPVLVHEAVLPGLSRETEYRFRIRGPDIEGREQATRRYVLDTSFYYRPMEAPKAARAGTAEAVQVARTILNRSGVTKGWCVVLGAGDGSLTVELARQSDLKLVIAEQDPAVVEAVRRHLDQSGIQGVRASVIHVTGNELPFGTFMANLVISESSMITGKPPFWPATEVHRLLRPAGGVALLGGGRKSTSNDSNAAAWKKWMAGSDFQNTAQNGDEEFPVFHRRSALAGAGDWSHQYGSADNSSTSMDEQVKGDLQISWWGDPGPRPMPDRGPRNPAPLSVNGRLYIQGDRILFGLDAYNGSILWTVIAPEVRRSNLPRDCSNMVADGRFLYVAHNRFCLTFDGQTGERRKRYSVPEGSPGQRFDWGYLAVLGNHLIGSRVKHESRYQGDDGEWYEDYHEDQVSRVTSESLFGLDPGTGAEKWSYRRGAILNSTITIGDEMIFFIESRNPDAVNARTGRLSPDMLTDTHLVALDLKSGAQLWEKPQDFSKLQFMTYLVYSQNTLVATGTDQSKVYHTYAFNAPAKAGPEGQPILLGGQQLWSDEHKEDKGHHSGHLQHPVVVDGVFYSDQRSFDLRSGKTLRTDLPERRGCGTMSAARNALFFRHHYQAMWDLKSDKRTQFEGIRSGCWLGLVPAGGMLLAPETSAGCSCTHAIQTSLGYLPRALATQGR